MIVLPWYPFLGSFPSADFYSAPRQLSLSYRENRGKAERFRVDAFPSVQLESIWPHHSGNGVLHLPYRWACLPTRNVQQTMPSLPSWRTRITLRETMRLREGSYVQSLILWMLINPTPSERLLFSWSRRSPWNSWDLSVRKKTNHSIQLIPQVAKSLPLAAIALVFMGLVSWFSHGRPSIHLYGMKN